MVELCRYSPPRMTLEEFLVWDAGDPSDTSWELVDSSATIPSPTIMSGLSGPSIGFSVPLAAFYRATTLAR